MKRLYFVAVFLLGLQTFVFGQTAEEFIEIGKTNYNANDFESASMDFTLALDMDPYNVEAYLYRGLCLMAMEVYQEAILDFSAVIDLDFENADGYFHRAEAKSNLEQYESAIEDYTLAIEYNPNHLFAYVYRAGSRFMLEDFENACIDWKKAKSMGATVVDAAIKQFCD